MWPFGYGNKYPYTNFHELNADWILSQLTKFSERLKEMGQKIKDMYDYWDNWQVAIEPTVSETINQWLDDHPEATTTVQDWSLTYQKLVRGTLGYVTPEMFGAAGDGTTDDTAAVQEALDSRCPVYLGAQYFLTDTVTITKENTIVMAGNRGALIAESGTILQIGNATTTLNNTYLFNITFLCRHLSDAILVDGYRVNKLYVYNCDFDMFKNYGILISCPTGYNYVEKCRFYTTEANTKYIHFGLPGSSIAVNYWFVRDNSFEFGTIADAGLNKDAIYMESGIVVKIENNDFANWNSGNCINMIPSDTLSAIDINDNIFYNIGNAICINMNRQLANYPIYNITVRNNFFDSESRTGKCIFTSEDAIYYITDVFLESNKIKGTWLTIYHINRISNLYLSALALVDSSGSTPACSSLCTYENTSNVHLPSVKYYADALIPAGESITLSIIIKDIPYSLQFYLPMLYLSHESGTGAVITASTYDNDTGEITATVSNTAEGPRYVVVNII